MKSNQNDKINTGKSDNRVNQKPGEKESKSATSPVKKAKQNMEIVDAAEVDEETSKEESTEEGNGRKIAGDSRQQSVGGKTEKQNVKRTNL
jgi:hypothetical protein